MNRRQFTASLGAVATLPLLPIPTAAAAVTAAELPPAAYAWAHLYARAQPTMSAAKLARYMRIETPVANQLFCKLVSDGVLGTPCSIGSASALKPIAKPNASHATSVVRHIQNAAEKLVKDDAVLLDANQHQDDLQESTHASPDQYLQESPARG